MYLDMDNFIKAAKILLDRELIFIKEQLQELKQKFKTPRVKYKDSSHWRSICEESMDVLSHGLADYINDNIVSGANIEEIGSVPMIIPKLELEIEKQLCACLKQISQSASWSERRAKEISLGIGTAFASFGRGIGMRTGIELNQSILNYIMTFIMCALKTSSPCGESIDTIPIVPCECCGKYMRLCWNSSDSVTQPWSWRIIDICDSCELDHIDPLALGM